jgi:genome maintenance exonuclease 1
MKTAFQHIHHDIDKLVRVDSPSGRSYQTPSGKAYPSVTSVLGLLGKAEIIEWRKRVGEEEANRVSARAARRGTAIHTLCENYLLNKEVDPGPFDLETFRSISPYLDKINNIHCLETQLYSDYLQVAGTVDCIAEFEGKLSVIDFKTSKRVKSRDDIHGYFMQTSAYAVMFEERTGIPIGKLVIIMAVDDDKPIIFQEKRDDWINRFIELREDYSKLHNK